MVSKLLDPRLVFFDIDAVDWRDLFRQLETRLRPAGVVTDDWLTKITDREAQFPTGLQTATTAIALPHADGCVVRPYIAVVRPVHPVAFDAMAGIGDAVDASLVINLGLTREGGQVGALQELMNLFMSEEAVADIMGQTTPQGMVSAALRHIR